MSATTAHIVETLPAQAIAAGTVALVCTTAAFGAWLLLQHHVVKYGQLRLDRIGRTGIVVLALAVGAAALPGSAASQDRELPVGLPDLISDPPVVWFTKTVELADGSIARVITFDGYLRNDGEGVLELFGNPQEPDGMKQRWWDGDAWVEESTPRVLFETTDGHNHFHLMAAAEYELWDDGQTTKVGDASKVGFCLLDSEQRAGNEERFYDLATFNYCEADNPDADVLRMGIMPGWVDLYDANTTLQWVDISTTQPGRYWIGSIIDPEDQIVESDETNNGLVFSSKKFAVAGAVARELPVQRAGEPIVLRADLYGQVGDVVWTVISGPANGTLDVPVGVDLAKGIVTYTPEPGFVGVDEFTVAARDVTSAYPLVPREIVVQVEATPEDASAERVERVDGPLEITGLPELWPLQEWESVDLDLRALATLETDEVAWFASSLPPGLTLDAATGQLSGVATMSPSGIASIEAHTPEAVLLFELPWSVAEVAEPEPGWTDTSSLSSTHGERVDRWFGVPLRDASYEATGLPEGGVVVPNLPLLTGDPVEIGEFEVEVTATLDGEVVDTTSFIWTIRPAAVPAFPL